MVGRLEYKFPKRSELLKQRETIIVALRSAKGRFFAVGNNGEWRHTSRCEGSPATAQHKNDMWSVRSRWPMLPPGEVSEATPRDLQPLN
jgi:hypothetical protein